MDKCADNKRQAKRSWMESLKVGDQVCDCGLRHLKIVNVTECWMPVPSNLFLKLTPDWLPDKLWHWIWQVHDFVCRKLNLMSLVDKDLILEGGYHCSAMSCCDPIDHEWKHDE